MTRFFVLLALAASGCEKTNAAYCDGVTGCPSGLACDPVAHECVPPLDLSASVDLARAFDLAGADFAGADLRAPADLATAPRDLTMSPPDLTMMSLPDLAPPPPDLAGACSNGCTTCVGCCTDTCTSMSGCNQSCPGACSCALTCKNTQGGSCQLSCTSAATCTVVADTVQDAQITCSAASTCDITCNNLHDCNVSCDATSTCILRCDPGDHKCQFTTCAHQVACPNNVIVCNRSTCP